MSAMADTAPCPTIPTREDKGLSTLRDLMLALSLTVLAALAMQASGAPVPNTVGTSAVIQDWKGNSGTLIVAPLS